VVDSVGKEPRSANSESPNEDGPAAAPVVTRWRWYLPPIRFSLAYPPQNVGWSDYIDLVTAADRTRFDAFWTFDHLLTIGGDPDGQEHECYTTMAALAQATQRIRIGALVSGVIYRNPALQIKMATEMDVLSHGRFNFGIGAGWAEREFKAFNIPFPETKVRLGTLRETLELAKLLWSGDPRRKVSFEGKYVQAHDLFINPQPVQPNGPPILVGGGGEQVTLRIAAHYADIWHGFGDLDTIKRKIGILDGYAPDYGRAGSDIAKSTNVTIWVGELRDQDVARIVKATGRPEAQVRGSIIHGVPAAIEARLRQYVDAGVTYFVVSAMAVGLNDIWERVSEEIIPRFSGG